MECVIEGCQREKVARGWCSMHYKRCLGHGDPLTGALSTDEVVHHRNGIRTDNRIENLELGQSLSPKGQRVDDKVEFAIEILQRYRSDLLARDLTDSISIGTGSPDEVRTRVTGLRGRRPRPLDDRAESLVVQRRSPTLARGEGLEPSITGPEPVVLPFTPPPKGRRLPLVGGAVCQEMIARARTATRSEHDVGPGTPDPTSPLRITKPVFRLAPTCPAEPKH